MKFASIDIGSNSVRHLIVDESGGTLSYRASSSRITRITEGLKDGNAFLLEHAVSRTEKALSEVIRDIEKYEVPRENWSFFATESLRAASNSQSVMERLETIAGVEIKVLSGEEEARRSFRGAASSFGCDSWVFDLGGGSLEISSEEGGRSYPLGAVRMTNRFGRDIAGLTDHITACLKDIDSSRMSRLIGVGGTSSSIAMMLGGIPVRSYSPGLIHGQTISKGKLEELGKFFLEKEGDPGPVTGLDPGRADIILAGIRTIETLLSILGVCSYIHSEADLLWGSIIESLEEKGIEFDRISFT
jgi:exopolyphosphatase/guanosine-5'-triphosphate,3'-diphosphate pyrophosphatase